MSFRDVIRKLCYRFVAAGCEIDMVTSAEIALAIFIAKHNLLMVVGVEFGLLAKKMWCTTVPVAPPGGGKNTNYRFSRFFVRSVPLFRSLMLTPMDRALFSWPFPFGIWYNCHQLISTRRDMHGRLYHSANAEL